MTVHTDIRMAGSSNGAGFRHDTPIRAPLSRGPQRRYIFLGDMLEEAFKELYGSDLVRQFMVNEDTLSDVRALNASLPARLRTTGIMPYFVSFSYDSDVPMGFYESMPATSRETNGYKIGLKIARAGGIGSVSKYVHESILIFRYVVNTSTGAELTISLEKEQVTVVWITYSEKHQFARTTFEFHRGSFTAAFSDLNRLLNVKILARGMTSMKVSTHSAYVGAYSRRQGLNPLVTGCFYSYHTAINSSQEFDRGSCQIHPYLPTYTIERFRNFAITKMLSQLDVIAQHPLTLDDRSQENRND